MPAAMELIGGFVTAPGTTLTAATAMSGNSFTVRNAADESGIYLVGLWARYQAAGVLRLRSPMMHDNVQGMRHQITINQARQLLAMPGLQRLKRQDVINMEISGSATAGDIEQAIMMVYYEDLPGVNARLITPEQVAARAVHLVTVENSITTNTSGNWSGEEAINSEYNLLRANTDYALLGYTVSGNCAAVRYRSTDFGNLGIGGPGDNSNPHITARWFVKLSEMTGLPMIPVINSANAPSILLDIALDENGGTRIVTSIFAQLAPE